MAGKPHEVRRHPSDLPFSALLSQVLVAFTIELDNEFERQMPHRTTTQRSISSSRDGPWLASLAMFSNFMQFVREEGVTVRELQSSARTKRLLLDGMRRWGYIIINPGPSGGRPKPPRPDSVLRPTEKGRLAQEVWRTLFDVIEKRWRARFGKNDIDALQLSLTAVVNQFNVELPEYLPVLGYGMVAEAPLREARIPGRDSGAVPHLHLPALLSKVLLAFTLEFERESDASLAISANVVRILGETGVLIRDLPLLSGVSKEAIKMALGFLEKRGYLVIEPHPIEVRTKVARLTPKGRKAKNLYDQLPGIVEERWKTRFGNGNICNLRASLAKLVGEPTADRSPLFRGLEPPSGGWRASVPRPDTLPHYPMVLHRGGYPDGS
jgi:DNA-binding MarR family transcriptional regulator